MALLPELSQTVRVLRRSPLFAALARFVRALLFEVSPADPLTLTVIGGAAGDHRSRELDPGAPCQPHGSARGVAARLTAPAEDAVR